ncbi:conserved hypothetical protein [Ricinus communis]|uniref:Uncharacterized protein n=1 Tax=Ricinus communis TaxID=3988 RepID=B9S9Z4_RICCO|nr:conserved hypothetical protein [Ricinus communis]
MSLQVSAVPAYTLTQNALSTVKRPSSSYHPTIWRDHFLTSVSHSKETGDSNSNRSILIS